MDNIFIPSFPLSQFVIFLTSLFITTSAFLPYFISPYFYLPYVFPTFLILSSLDRPLRCPYSLTFRLVCNYFFASAEVGQLWTRTRKPAPDLRKPTPGLSSPVVKMGLFDISEVRLHSEVKLDGANNKIFLGCQ